MENDISQRVQKDGFALLPGVLGSEEIPPLLAALGELPSAGRRGLLAVPEVEALANSRRLLELVRPHLRQEPRPVRAIYFNKTPAANWLVAWHQDLTIAVRARADVPGFGPWTNKDQTPHVQPPAALLEQMLTVRLHLDEADEMNGALRVLAGSHRLGRLSPEQIAKLRGEGEECVCASAAGAAMLMRPLLLHASGRSTTNRNRCVLHLEYAGFDLPPPLQWPPAQ